MAMRMDARRDACSIEPVSFPTKYIDGRTATLSSTRLEPSSAPAFYHRPSQDVLGRRIERAAQVTPQPEAFSCFRAR